MEFVQILAQANTTEDVPDNWIVLPLLRQKVITGLFGWVFGAILGGGLFALIAPIMIPHNYQIGTVGAVVSTVILVIVLYVCLGSLWSFISDIRRLRCASQHLIVITPTDFVKQEGEKIIHVPLEYIKHVTARGVPPVDRSIEAAREDSRIGGMSEGIGSFIVGRRVAESGRRGSGRKRMRTPTTLAFIDERTDAEIIVVSDKAYGDPYLIAAHLKEYVRAKIQNTVI